MKRPHILKYAGHTEVSMERRTYDYIARCRICGKRLKIIEHPSMIPTATEILIRAHVHSCVARVDALIMYWAASHEPVAWEDWRGLP